MCETIEELSQAGLEIKRYFTFKMSDNSFGFKI